MKYKRNLSTPYLRAFWATVDRSTERALKEVQSKHPLEYVYDWPEIRPTPREAVVIEEDKRQ